MRWKTTAEIALATAVLFTGCTNPVVIAELPAPPTYVPFWRDLAYLKPRVHEIGAGFGTAVVWLDDRLVIGAPGSGDCALDPEPAGIEGRCRSEGLVSIAEIPADDTDQYTLLTSADPQTNSAFARNLASTERWLFASSFAHAGDDDGTLLARAGTIDAFRRTADGVEPTSLVIEHPDARAQAQLGYALDADGPWLATVERFRGCQVEDEPCPSEATVTIFEEVGDAWVHAQSIVPDAWGVPFGSSSGRPSAASITIEGERIAFGLPHDDPCATAVELPCPEAGTVRIIERIGGAWTEVGAPITAPQPVSGGHFGASVALEGERLFVGSPGAGAIWIFEAIDGVWTKTHGIHIADDDGSFGAAMDVEGDRLLVGAPNEGHCLTGIEPDRTWDDSCNRDGFGPGAAFVYELRDGVFEEILYVKPPTLRPRTTFGASVALRGDWIAVGASGEANLGEGIGNPGLEGTDDVGAVFVYELK